jgi:metal-responsive CopG/Arc/MetJ family transcriptional regulator
MAKKVIQVPIDDLLLGRLNEFSGKQNCTRSEFIRNACLHYLEHVEKEDLDRRYREGYGKFPEELDTGLMQVTVSHLFLTKEPW